MTSNKKLFNYKVVDHVEDYNFDIKLSLFEFIWKKYELFFYIKFLDRFVLTQMRVKTKFRKRRPPNQQVKASFRYTQKPKSL